MAATTKPHPPPLKSKLLVLLFVPLAFITAQIFPLLPQCKRVLLHNRQTALTRYSNHGPVNNQKCVVKYEANACEDVKIHFASSTAFIACGDPEGRSHWYPPSNARDAAGRSNETFREDLFKYDIKKGRTTKLRIEGLVGDFISHGIDVYGLEGEDKVHIFAVNHGRGGDSVVILSHQLGSDSVQVVKEVRHQGIKTANGVAANGPLDFFITNDHMFAGGILRDFEDRYGPLPGATNVQYCDASGDKPQCRQVSSSYPNFNGIAISEDKKQLFVADSTMGDMTVFSIADNKELSWQRSVELGAAADNIKLLPNSGDPIIAVFATLENLPHYIANVERLGKDLHIPSAAIRLVQKRDYAPEVVFWDDGSILSYMTAATIDPHNRVLIGAGVLQYGGFVLQDLIWTWSILTTTPTAHYVDLSIEQAIDPDTDPNNVQPAGNFLPYWRWVFRLSRSRMLSSSCPPARPFFDTITILLQTTSPSRKVARRHLDLPGHVPDESMLLLREAGKKTTSQSHQADILAKSRTDPVPTLPSLPALRIDTTTTLIILKKYWSVGEVRHQTASRGSERLPMHREQPIQIGLLLDDGSCEEGRHEPSLHQIHMILAGLQKTYPRLQRIFLLIAPEVVMANQCMDTNVVTDAVSEYIATYPRWSERDGWSGKETFWCPGREFYEIPPEQVRTLGRLDKVMGAWRSYCNGPGLEKYGALNRFTLMTWKNL
ncbi:hypothetical protein FQN52_002553 [Onygenales sp. PD_12]|nr:hypothetical protein FQN52_002553 [Onygenales sp. PD_12]